MNARLEINILPPFWWISPPLGWVPKAMAIVSSRLPWLEDWYRERVIGCLGGKWSVWVGGVTRSGAGSWRVSIWSGCPALCSYLSQKTANYPTSILVIHPNKENREPAPVQFERRLYKSGLCRVKVKKWDSSSNLSDLGNSENMSPPSSVYRLNSIFPL